MRTLRLLFVSVCCLAALPLVAQRQPTPSQLPAFRFTDAQTGQPLTEASLRRGLNTVVLFFDPDCDHCQQQAEWIADAAGQFKNTQFLWISTAPAARVVAFAQQYFTGTALPMRWALDTEYKVDDYFGYSTVPSLYIFGTSGRLKQTYRNEVAAELILSSLD